MLMLDTIVNKLAVRMHRTKQIGFAYLDDTEHDEAHQIDVIPLVAINFQQNPLAPSATEVPSVILSGLMMKDVAANKSRLNVFGNNQFSGKEIRYHKRDAYTVLRVDASEMIAHYHHMEILKLFPNLSNLDKEHVKAVYDFLRDYSRFMARDRRFDNAENRYDMRYELPKSAEQFEGIIEMEDLEKVLCELPQDSLGNIICPENKIEIMVVPSATSKQEIYHLLKTYEHNPLGDITVHEPFSGKGFGKLLGKPFIVDSKDIYGAAGVNGSSNASCYFGGVIDVHERDRKLGVVISLWEHTPSSLVCSHPYVVRNESSIFRERKMSLVGAQALSSSAKGNGLNLYQVNNDRIDLSIAMVNMTYNVSFVPVFEASFRLEDEFTSESQFESFMKSKFRADKTSIDIFEKYFRAQIEAEIARVSTPSRQVTGISLGEYTVYQQTARFDRDKEVVLCVAAAFIVK